MLNRVNAILKIRTELLLDVELQVELSIVTRHGSHASYLVFFQVFGYDTVVRFGHGTHHPLKHMASWLTIRSFARSFVHIEHRCWRGHLLANMQQRKSQTKPWNVQLRVLLSRLALTICGWYFKHERWHHTDCAYLSLTDSSKSICCRFVAICNKWRLLFPKLLRVFTIATRCTVQLMIRWQLSNFRKFEWLLSQIRNARVAWKGTLIGLHPGRNRQNL